VFRGTETSAETPAPSLLSTTAAGSGEELWRELPSRHRTSRTPHLVDVYIAHLQIKPYPVRTRFQRHAVLFQATVVGFHSYRCWDDASARVRLAAVLAPQQFVRVLADEAGPRDRPILSKPDGTSCVRVKGNRRSARVRTASKRLATNRRSRDGTALNKDLETCDVLNCSVALKEKQFLHMVDCVCAVFKNTLNFRTFIKRNRT